MKVAPAFDRLRNESRFREILRRVGLADETGKLMPSQHVSEREGILRHPDL